MDGNPIVLERPVRSGEDHSPDLYEEVRAAINALKKSKSAGIDNIPAEPV